jgi:hypothetical protein
MGEWFDKGEQVYALATVNSFPPLKTSVVSASCSNDDSENVSKVRDRKDMEHGRSRPERDE